MELNVVGLLREVNAVVDVDIKAPVESFEYLGENIRFDGDVELVGKLSRVRSKYYRLDGEVEASVVLVCGKCMGDYVCKISFPVELHFAQEQKAIDNDVDMYYTDGDVIYLDEAVQTNAIMNIPAKRECSDDCKGMCPVCGINLNIECCDCDKGEEESPIDSRFAALKDFFEK
ncbi:MAG: DUF177 domain-containing protein [Clostridia bacterium]|nr:DUF177 domain-containing protein [Clostridia bacterium]